MTGPRLGGRGVLVTRAAAQSADLVAAIEREGGRAYVHPVLAIAPPDDSTHLDAAAAAVDEYDWVLLTSQNAADAFLSRLALGAAPRALACVGASTARTCEKRGFRVDLVPETFNADALLEALTARLGDAIARSVFLMPRAEEGRETLPQGLRERGARVDVVIAYRTVPADAEKATLLRELDAKEINVLSFASPSAVTFFHRLLEGEPLLARVLRLPTVCIGAVTAARAEDLGFSTVVTAVASRLEAFLGAIAACEIDDAP